MHARTKTKRRREFPSRKPVPLPELRDRLRSQLLARKAWAALVQQCYEFVQNGKALEARRLIPEIERLRDLMARLEAAARRK